jgi:hypothetical protein
MLKRYFATCVAALSVFSAHADDTSSGKVSRILVVTAGSGAPGNADMRVYLSGSAVCNGSADPSWGFVDLSDPGYKSMLAVMLMAQATGKTVTLVSRASVLGAGGSLLYCRILYAQVADS